MHYGLSFPHRTPYDCSLRTLTRILGCPYSCQCPREGTQGSNKVVHSLVKTSFSSSVSRTPRQMRGRGREGSVILVSREKGLDNDEIPGPE